VPREQTDLFFDLLYVHNLLVQVEPNGMSYDFLQIEHSFPSTKKSYTHRCAKKFRLFQ
jgi:hypothetical protein